MIRQIKIGLKLLRYSHGVRLSISIAAVLVMFAMAIEFVPVFKYSRILGDYLILANGMWLIQLLYSINFASLVQTSRWKKKLQTSVPAIVGFSGYALSYLFIIIIKLPGFVGADAGQRADISAMLFMDAVIGAGMMIYSGMAYKFFIPSTIIFFVMFYRWYYSTGSGMSNMPQIDLPVWEAAGAGYLILVAGAMLQYGMTRLLYRFPLDKRGQGRGLHKYM